MKTKFTFTKLVACAALAILSGCSKEQPAADTQAQGSKATEAVKTETTKAVDAAKTETTKAVDTVKTEAAKTVDTAKSQTQQASDSVAPQANATQQQAQGLIDKAKSLIGEQKYQEAMTSLSQLGKSQLTSDQQKTVDNLMAQIQSALAKAGAKDATSSLGGALGGKQ